MEKNLKEVVELHIARARKIADSCDKNTSEILTWILDSLVSDIENAN